MQLYGAMLHFQTNGGILALANGKEIQELDITPLLDMPSSVMEDDCELDLLGLDRFESTYFVAIQFSCTYTFFFVGSRDLDNNVSSYLVVQTPSDRQLLSQLSKSNLLWYLHTFLSLLHCFFLLNTKIFLDLQVPPTFLAMLLLLPTVVCLLEVL